MNEVRTIEQFYDFVKGCSFQYSNEDICVIFDVDETLIRIDDREVFCDDKFDDWFDLLSVEEKNEYMYKNFIPLTFSLIEKKSLKVVKSFIEERYFVMGCTAMPGYAFKDINFSQWRIDHLAKLGISFPLRDCSLQFDDMVFEGGILFNGWNKRKGSCLREFFSAINFSPKKVFFLDDKIEQCESVADEFGDLCFSVNYKKDSSLQKSTHGR